VLFNPAKVPTTRYRYRGAETGTAGAGGGSGKPTGGNAGRAPRVDLTGGPGGPASAGRGDPRR